jgi:carbon-monoxide dehydrogenase small subunit
MTVDFALTAPTPETTTVRMDADVTLSGAIAQFGRTGIINETTKILIGDFVARLEERLAPVERQAVVAEAPRLGVVRLLWIGVKAWLGRMFGRAV